MSSISCKKCGARVSKEYSSCTNCGATLKPLSTRLDLPPSTVLDLPPFRRPPILVASVFVSAALSLVSYHSELVSWIIFLMSNFIILASYKLLTHREIKVGKWNYSIRRQAGYLILELLFAFIGFMVLGQTGGLLGIFTAFIIIGAAQILKKHFSFKF